MPRRPLRAIVLRLGEAAEVKLAARIRTAPTKHFRGVLALSGGPAVAFVVRMAREDASLFQIARGHLLNADLAGNLLTHTWPRASSAAGEARRDARGTAQAQSAERG